MVTSRDILCHLSPCSSIQTKSKPLGLAILVLLPVHQGITAYIMQRFDLEQFCQNIEENKITVTFVVPPVVLLLAKHHIVDKYNLSSLRMIHSSAAPLTKDLVGMIYDRLKVPIKQGYGLSEASPGVTTQVSYPQQIHTCSADK